jgi:hypothetical protein
MPGSAYEQALEALGRAMVDDGKSADSNIPSGYTYFGQFIDHDLSLDLTPLALAQPCAERAINLRRPFLDLDHLYGGGPGASPFLYVSTGPPGNERFLIGPTYSKHSEKEMQPDPCDPHLGSLNDVPRNSVGVALVGDPRQDENLIIAQLHVAFLRFHNFVMDELDKLSAGKPAKVENAGPYGATRFEQARRIVTWTYQYLVLNDFLQGLIDSKVWEAVARGVRVAPAHGEPFSIPIEFNVAAFRFGHSMVRDDYRINDDHTNADLACLFALTGLGNGQVQCSEVPEMMSFRLPEEWKIDWRAFFASKPAKPQLNMARPIDTAIAQGLHNVPAAAVRLFNRPQHEKDVRLAPPEHVLPVRTLWRGARVGLPSGQDVARAFGLAPLDSVSEIATGQHAILLQKAGLDVDTPLWYYILKEAEVRGAGGSLGEVGSRIVAGTIVSALQSDPTSYVSLNPGWQPKLNGKPVRDLVPVLDSAGVF